MTILFKLKEDLPIRAYRVSDKGKVLNLLRLNTPKYFSPEEYNDLEYYLENEIEYYYVIEMESKIVGSGGFNLIEDKTTGVISWDILHPDFQRKSLGSALLKYRIQEIQKFENVHKIIVRTSQLVYKFYEKLGFNVTGVVEDYWAKDFDLVKMEYNKQGV